MRHGVRNRGNKEDIEDLRVTIYDLRIMDMDDLKKIKMGVPVVLHGSFGEVRPDGNVMIFANGHEVLMSRRAAESRLEKKVFFERRFRAGDEVNVTSRDGRFPVVFPMNHTWFGERVTVVEDEDDSGFVQVRSEYGHKLSVAFFFLELVTPVEERMPYSIDPANTNVLFKHGKKLAIFADDDEAQELCKRLNAEWQTKVCRSEERKEEA